MTRYRSMVLPAFVLLVIACSTHAPHRAPPSGGHAAAHGSPTPDGRPVLYDSLESYSYRITTSSPDAQRWFDQGLRLVYAFNRPTPWAQADVTLSASRF